MQNNIEVLIIGGGVQGLSVGAHLVKEGIRNILVLERGEIPHRNSSTERSAAMIQLQAHTLDERTISLNLLSYEEYANFSKYFEYDIGFQKSGSVLVSFDDKLAGDHIKKITKQKSLGVPVSSITIQELQNLAPFMNAENMKSAVYCEFDGYVDQVRVLKGYKSYIQKNAQDGQYSIRENTEVTGIKKVKGEKFEVATSNEIYEAKFVVNASGPFASTIGKYVDKEIPVAPNLRTLWHARPTSNSIEIESIPILENLDDEWYIKPDVQNNQILVGVGITDDPHPNLDDISNFQPRHKKLTEEYLASHYSEGVEWELGSGWAGIRSITTNNQPIIGTLSDLPNFINVVGWSGYGVMQAPISGQLISNLIATGKSKYLGTTFDGKPLEVDLADFSLETQIKVRETDRSRRKVGGKPSKAIGWRFQNNDAIQAGFSLKKFAQNKKEDGPFYIYSKNIIEDRIKKIQRNFPSFDIIYSTKTNPALAIVSLMKNLGLGAEIVSNGEFEIVKSLGFDLSKVAVTEPGKQYEELSKYIKAGVGMIHVESRREINLVNQISRELGISTDIVIRVNPLFTIGSAKELMSGASKFGIPEEEVTKTVRSAETSNIRVKGVHVFSGSQVLVESDIISNFEKIGKLANNLSTKLGISFELVNFGGGFGVPYNFEEEMALDIESIGKKTEKLINALFKSRDKPKFYLELGRYLVAEAGLFTTQVIEIKRSRGTNYIITDSGISNFARPAMPWAEPHHCYAVGNEVSANFETFTVVGSLCQPSDVLHPSQLLPTPMPGDYIAFTNAGAYGYTMSPQMYHSLGAPAEYLIVNDKPHLIRKPITNGDTLKGQLVPKMLES